MCVTCHSRGMIASQTLPAEHLFSALRPVLQHSAPPTDQQSMESTSIARSLPEITLEDDGDIATLTNDISPLYSRRNFRLQEEGRQRDEYIDGPGRRISRQLYYRLIPFLQLATKLHDQTEDFFVRLLHAPLKNLSKDGCSRQMISHDYKVTSLDRTMYRLSMQEVAKNLNFFLGYDDSFVSHGWAWAIGNRKERTAYVQISHAYTNFFEHPDYDTFDAELKQRIGFTLAVTLVHEHAHTVWQKRIWGKQLFSDDLMDQEAFDLISSTSSEPVFDSIHAKAEVGYAWERFAFGGSPSFTTDKEHCLPINKADFSKMRSINLDCGHCKVHGKADACIHESQELEPYLVQYFLDGDLWTMLERLDQQGNFRRQLHPEYLSNVLVCLIASSTVRDRPNVDPRLGKGLAGRLAKAMNGSNKA